MFLHMWFIVNEPLQYVLHRFKYNMSFIKSTVLSSNSLLHMAELVNARLLADDRRTA